MAYGVGPEDLFGPESLYPQPLRGDLGNIHFIGGDKFRSLPAKLPSAALLFAGATYRVSPLVTPIGNVLMSDPHFYLLTILMDIDGEAKLGPFPINPNPANLAFQAGFVNFDTLTLRMSNAIKIDV